MKKVTAIITVLLAISLLLCACGDAKKEDSKETGAAVQVSGEITDTGVIQTICPSGWLYMPQTDMFAEQDAEGNYPVDPKKMAFIKGGESEFDAFSKPTVYIYYNEYEFEEGDLELQQIMYEEVENVDYSIGGKKCFAFTAKSLVTSEKDYYGYFVIFYPIAEGKNVQFTIPTHWGEADGVSVEDADVQAIINNLKLD